MTFQKNAMTLGLCLGLCISMFSQGSPAKRTVKGASPDMSVSDRPVCPAPKGAQHKVIDLCALSRTMSNQPREMEFRELAGTSNWKGVHEDVTLWVGRGDEVIWECTGPHVSNFKIVSIKRIQHKRSASAGKSGTGPALPTPPAPADFPFCDAFKKQIGADHPVDADDSGHATEWPATTRLHSGPARKEAAGECYKYSFTVDGTLFDPHLIVTGGSPTDPLYRKQKTEQIQCHFGNRAKRHPHTEPPPKKQ